MRFIRANNRTFALRCRRVQYRSETEFVSGSDPVGYEEAKERVSIYGDMYPEAVATTVTAAEGVRLKALKSAQKGRKTRREALFNKIIASREDCVARLIEYRIT